MSKALKNVGPINGTTGYVDGILVSRNSTIKLPEVTYKTATIQTAGGEQEIPLRGLLESLEASIQKIGIDLGLGKLLTLESKTYEFRWAQQVTEPDGKTSIQGCKAFIKAIPKVAVPEMEIATGESVETEIPLSVTRYQLYVGGDEIVLVDKLTGQVRINGIDYADSVESLL